jgi:hypothetical protein
MTSTGPSARRDFGQAVHWQNGSPAGRNIRNPRLPKNHAANSDRAMGGRLESEIGSSDVAG